MYKTDKRGVQFYTVPYIVTAWAISTSVVKQAALLIFKAENKVQSQRKTYFLNNVSKAQPSYFLFHS